ncbi:protein DDI1 homolog 2 isoform X1 [Hypomesus transpacificus]|uniref:protein DDI1 homolog 2 isoform X1 n=1 Tax=Hypomesus transpacificus TaxID=137520 RepID=UPI001F080057|nr:protein DDI1 homolog 2 isoform X1 [Hypomesus transpacificus]
MLVTVFCAPRELPETTFALDVSPELELRDFVALCELESGIPAGEIQILYIEQPLKDLTRALGTYGLKDGDVVVLRQADRRPPPAFSGLPRIDFSSIAVPGTSTASQRPAKRQQQQQPHQSPNSQQQQQRSPPPPAPPTLGGSASSPQGLDDPALLQQMLLANPHELSLLKERNPPLAEALLSGDLERFTKVLSEQQQDRARREQERIRLLTADPFDLDAQAKIEEDIRQHNVEENMTIAMEEAPESFGQVVMLYINCKVNGHPVKAFVDSGAQMTIMSQACAERCNIMRLVDRRWAGIAKGVGTQKIIGRVHLAQVQIEGDFLPCSFSILEDQPMDMLLGLDMLKRHQCSIDLKKNLVLIGTTGTETHFLPESELPECARLAYGAEGREDVRQEEMADRELAEALERSVQESDTADGQTTSPSSSPFPMPRPLNQTATSTSSTPSHLRSLGRSESAPASVHQAPTAGQSPSQPGFPGLPGSSSQVQATAPTAPKAPPPATTNPTRPPPPTPSALDPLSAPSPPPAAKAATGTPPPTEGQVPTAPEVDTGPEEGAEGLLLPRPDDLSPAQPMEQEGDVSASTAGTSPRAPRATEGEGSPQHQSMSTAPSLPLGACIPASARDGAPDQQPGSAEMESPSSSSSSQGAVPSERDQPEGERGPGSDHIPSLAAALLELHELLVSNSHAPAQDRSASCSPPRPFRSDAEGPDGDRPAEPLRTAPTPENPDPPPSTAITTAGADASDAKANHAAVPTRGPPPQCLAPGSSGQDEESPGTETAAEATKGRGRPQASDRSCGRRADRRGAEDAGATETEGPSPRPGHPALREPPEGQQGRGVADGRASGAPEPGQPSPLSLAVGSPEEAPGVSPLPSSPEASSSARLFSAPGLSPPARFPSEHIRRIQAAGFSAREAVEALEEARGSVELALMALLARNITVPT